MGKSFYTSNEEYGFEVEYDKDCLWSESPIPLPIIDGEPTAPDSF